jgi:hypothetical protein
MWWQRRWKQICPLDQCKHYRRGICISQMKASQRHHLGTNRESHLGTH